MILTAPGQCPGLVLSSVVIRPARQEPSCVLRRRAGVAGVAGRRRRRQSAPTGCARRARARSSAADGGRDRRSAPREPRGAGRGGAHEYLAAPRLRVTAAHVEPTRGGGRGSAPRRQTRHSRARRARLRSLRSLRSRCAARRSRGPCGLSSSPLCDGGDGRSPNGGRRSNSDCGWRRCARGRRLRDRRGGRRRVRGRRFGRIEAAVAAGGHRRLAQAARAARRALRCKRALNLSSSCCGDGCRDRGSDRRPRRRRGTR